MVVVVNADVVRLDEPDDCGAFKVVVESGTGAGVSEALAEVGRLADRETAWIGADAVRALAAGRVGPDWEDKFAAMVGYASTKGWLSEDGTEIQAHIEWRE